MAQAPLFVKDLATLQASLRLSGVSQSDPAAMILGAMSKARITFSERLGAEKITALLGTVETDNPIQPADIQRTRASQCETAIVKLHLMRAMPILFMDASGSIQQDWNETGIVRTAGSELKDELKRLEEEIEGYLEVLAGEATAGGSVEVSVFGRAGRNCYPGQEIFSRRRPINAI